MKHHALQFMQGAHEVAHLRTEDTLHREFIGRYYVNFQAARPQRRRHLKSDKACAHHQSAARDFRPLDDGAAILQRSQGENMWQIRAGQG